MVQKPMIVRLWLFCFLFISAGLVSAKIEIHQFDNPQQEKLYTTLTEQLRCLVCQNQNLADSNADLAQDMRNKTYQMVRENKSKQEIINYWVDRYGEFVLYDPPFERKTLILWGGPFVLLLLALYVGRKMIKSTQTQMSDPQDNSRDKAQSNQKDEQEHEKIRALLEKQ